MPDSTIITRDQLRTVLVSTELGGRLADTERFSYARLGRSTYSFGQMQFDVGNNPDAEAFLRDNGFDDRDIASLSKHGGLLPDELSALNVKLKAVPQERMDQFTNDQLDKTIADVGKIVDHVCKQSPANADAISKDLTLQLGIADYTNQFSPPYNQLMDFLAAEQVTIKSTGITIQASNPPTREDLQSFIAAGAYGHNPANARAVEGRAQRFNDAMSELGLAPPTHSHDRNSHGMEAVLKLGMHGDSVAALQTELAALGYTDHRGQILQRDGQFGRSTEAAVKAFQSDNGLSVDGKAGRDTLDAIQALRHSLNAIPALAPELDGYSHQRIDSFAPANRIPANPDWRAPIIPDREAPLIRPYTDPAHPAHGLYAELRQRIPNASENRIVECTAACHMAGIRSGELGQIQLRGNEALMFAPAGGLGSRAEVALTTPAPSMQQTMQQVQAFEQNQQVAIAQMSTQQQQTGPVIGGPRIG